MCCCREINEAAAAEAEVVFFFWLESRRLLGDFAAESFLLVTLRLTPPLQQQQQQQQLQQLQQQRDSTSFPLPSAGCSRGSSSTRTTTSSSSSNSSSNSSNSSSSTMASYVDDELEGSLEGGLTTEGGNLMGATSLDMTQAPGRRGAAAAAAAAARAATATATEAEIDWRAEALAQQQLGLDSTREKTARLKDLTEVFLQSLAALPGVTQQLDALQQSAAAVCSGLGSVGPSKEGRMGAPGGPPSLGLAPRVLIPIADLVSLSNVSFYKHPLVAQPCVALPALEAALAEEWKARGALGPPPRVGLTGWLGSDHLTPRGLCSSKLNRLVCVEGVVNRCSGVHPKLQKAVYITEPVGGPPQGGPQQTQGGPPQSEDREVHIRTFYDVTDLDKDVRDAQPPPEKDPEGRKVNRQELGYCQYENHQKFYIQEAPETSPTGQLPRWVEVAAEGDLCESVKCGDRVRVYGVYRPRTGGPNNQTTGFVRPLLVANNLQVLSAAARAWMLQSVPADLLNIKAFASRKDLLQVLTRSLAPAVCGNDVVKRGLVLMLAGGAERRSVSGHRIRGDIHVLLVGDPSAGKSQLLRFVLGLIPGAVSATGRGSSGVGLTAAVITDPDTGERRVEGGAMVLADRSLICIDEFDKMQHGDRVAIHETMEQQTVTVAKAGIHATLNARCSVLAAANPLYGCWSADLSFKSQLAFEDSLLTRFDLIFVIRDATSTEEDERLAEAVLRNVTEKAKPAVAAAAEDRRSAADGLVQPQADMVRPVQAATAAAAAGGALRVNADTQEDAEPTRAFYHRNEMLYYDKQGREHECLTHDFLRKYIALVRSGGLVDGEQQQQQQLLQQEQQEGPQLSDEAAALIIEFYGEIRQRAFQQKSGGGRAEAGIAASLMQAVTVRTLEACVRLATAHAKLRLRKWIGPEDVKVAQQMLLYTLFGEAFEQDVEGGGGDSESETGDSSRDSEDEEEEEGEEEYLPKRTTAADRAARRLERQTRRQEAAKRQRARKNVEAEGALVLRLLLLLLHLLLPLLLLVLVHLQLVLSLPRVTHEAMASEMEGLGLAETKKRRTRQGRSAEEQREAVEVLHSQGLRRDILHSLIVNTIKLVDEGSGISEAALLDAVNARAKAKNLPAATSAEFSEALQELNAKDSAPILVHDGLVYEC
ncbi:hypothetical protein Emed_003107 [Eimeria media]